MDEDKLGKEVLEAVKETQQANRFILKRLTQLLQEPHNHCTCFRLHEQSQKDIKELQSKIDNLEKELAEKDESHKQTSIRFEILKERIYSLEESLMALQTDDSKLRSASLRKEKASKLENECTDDLERHSEQLTPSRAEERSDVDQTKRTSHVAQIHSVEHLVQLVSKKKTGKSDVLGNADVPVKTDASSNIQEGAVGGLSLQDNTFQTANKSSSNLTDKPSDQSTTVSVSQPESTTEEMNNRNNLRQMPVEVVRSTEKETYDSENVWRLLARQEIENAHNTLKDLEGVHTVICLDISASMAEGNAWLEATTFLEDYLKELSDMSDRYEISDEFVALVTFGHVSRVQMRLTNKYNDMQELIGKQKLGGPSPLYAGLAFGLAAAGSSDHICHQVGFVQMFTKIIIVTDGHTTEVGQYAGPDTPGENMDETKAKILQCMEEYTKSQVDTFCVPVGNADKQFLELMTAVADGKIISYTSGKRMARRQYLATKIKDPLGLGLFGSVKLEGNSAELSEEDRQTIDEFMEDLQKHLIRGLEQNVINKYKEIPDKNLPPIGSRVRRGPDWKWGTQDSFGAGTLIGHEDNKQVWVEWDADGHVNVYRYGNPGYDILIVEEPRELKSGQKIAVGCVVKLRHKGQKGVVVKLDESKEIATVRWNDGKRGEYSYGEKGNGEIEVCTGFEPFTSQGYVLGSGESRVPVKKTKNKNKNV